MAGINGGLTASIRRKLQDGRTPEEIVQELVAGGLTEVSAQRFVDRALAEHASAPPLPDVPAQAASDSIDQFIQTRQAGAVTTGHKPLIMASLLMCSGIAITGFSYIMAADGERYTLMWGPVAFGFVVFASTVIKGFTHPRTFAWLAAAASITVPIVLAGALWTVAMATAPMEEEFPLADLTTDQPPAEREEVARLINRLTTTKSPTTQCDTATRLGNVVDEEKTAAFNALMKTFDGAVNSLKVCIAGTMVKLEPPMAAAIYEGWSHDSDPDLRRAAINGYGELGADFTESGLLFLGEELKSPEPATRFMVVTSLTRMGPDAKPLLELCAEDEDYRVRTVATNALKNLP